MLNNIFNEIEKANAIVILTHQFPDGDAVSSCLAFGILLKGKADIIIPSFPKNFLFLPFSDTIKGRSDKEYDLAIALDCADTKRLVGYEEYFKKAKKTIVIDHHITSEFYGTLSYVDATVPACTQILTDIFRTKDYKINKDIAICLLTGIISDTCGFTERKITANTFEIVSYLVGVGADYKEIYTNIMERCNEGQFKLKQMVVSRVEIVKNIATSYLTKEDIFGYDTIDHKYLLKEYQNIEGVDVIVLFIEYPDVIKVSLRSENINVLSICKKFNGGGHKNSAGCVIMDTLENVKKKILKELI